jgi:hypothetical protein
VVSQAILVMAEYGVGDSPLWFRVSKDNSGLADAAELGLSPDLRRDLGAWNDVFDAIAGTGFQFPSREVRERHGVDAFDLAARVQGELGDDSHVWCGAGGGIDMFPGLDDVVVLAANSVGTTVERWHKGRSQSLTAGSAGARENTSRAIVRWRALTERTGDPFGDAQTRSEGLKAAGRLQRDLEGSVRVIFFAGARTPDDYGVD